MPSCFFSIVIPAYNYARFLERAIRSVLDQQFHDCEVIVVNDGSTDNTHSLMQELLQEGDTRLRYISQQNGGVSAARNKGLSQSCGSYLIFLDADDELLPESLKSTHSYLKENPLVDLLICDYLAKMPDGREKLRTNKRLPSNSDKWFLYFTNNRMAMANGATIIRRSAFNNIKYCEELRQAEDIPVFAQMLANFQCALFLKPLMINTKHDKSLRHQIHFTPEIAQDLTRLLFNSACLPKKYMRYKSGFLAHQYFQLFYSYEKAKKYRLASKCYGESLRVDPWRILNLRLHIKYFRCLLKLLFSSLAER